MTSTVSSPESFIESFPHPILPKIIGLPTYTALADIKKSLAANAASVASNRGGGTNGYLGIILSPAVYATVSPTPFALPIYPGAQPIIPPGTTAANTSAIIRQHTEELREWREYINISAALRNQLIEAIDPIYLRSQRNRHTGYAGVSIRDLLQYLITTYGLITPLDLKKNNDQLNEQWDPNTPFEHLIDQIEEAVDYADAGNQPYTQDQVLNAAYTIIFNTGMFFEDCKAWRLLPANDKTWDNLKAHFTEAHQQQRIQQATMQGAGYHKANNITHQAFPYEETATALANLATATAADRQAMNNLTTTIDTLTKQLAARDAEIVTLRDKLGKPKTDKKRPSRTDHGGYCWSHGYFVAKNHNSENCYFPKDGHQKTATRENTMNGNTFGKPK